MLYLVSYDLKVPGKDYPPLIAALTRLQGVKILLSTWLVPSDASAADLREHIQQEGRLDSSDRLFAGELKNHAAWVRLLVSDEAVQRIFRNYATG